MIRVRSWVTERFAAASTHFSSRRAAGRGSAVSFPALAKKLPPEALTTPCGSSAGILFNLEPRADPLPQNGTAVDFLPDEGSGGGDLVVGSANDMRSLTSGSGTAPDFRGIFGLTSQTGFYVHRNASDLNACSPDFEGGLGVLLHPVSGNPLVGVGFAAVAAYPSGHSFYIADTRVGEGEGSASVIGVFRTTSANLTNPAVCPDG